MSESGIRTPISIREATSNIAEGKYVLPAIQRKFVWSADQITALTALCVATQSICLCFGMSSGKKTTHPIRFLRF